MSNKQFDLFDIPEAAELPGWLEQRLVGLDLRDLVIGLAAVNEDEAADVTLTDICGSSLDAVSESGLKVLSADQLRALLKHPHALFELQEHVLIQGGPYWSSVEPSVEDQDKLDASLAGTLSKLRELPTQRLTNSSPSVAVTEPTAGNKSLRNYWPILALAAAVLLAIGIWRPKENATGGGWGFDQAELLTANVSSKEYMTRLSDAAGAFSKKTPDSREGTLKRLKEFKAGCKKLIAATHPQLAKQDRDWLITKCKNWLSKIEAHIAELEQDKRDWQDVLREAGETAKRMREVLRKQADEMV